MAWIESHQSLRTHRKTLRAAGRLGVSRYLFLGHLHALWWWGLDNLDAQGDLTALTDEEIAEGADWPNWHDEGTTFVAALTAAGFVDVDAGGERRLHDWYSYAGKYLDQRAANATRMQAARLARKQQQERQATPITERTFAARAANVQRGDDDAQHARDSARAGVTEPYRTVPDSTAPAAGGKGRGVAPGAAPRPSATEPTALALTKAPAAPDATHTPKARNETHPFKPLWEAFDAVLGEVTAPTEKTRRAKACKELDGHYSAADVVSAAGAWANVMGNMTMTELGLAANMGKLLHGPQRHGRSNGTTMEHRQRITESATVRHMASAADLLGLDGNQGNQGAQGHQRILESRESRESRGYEQRELSDGG